MALALGRRLRAARSDTAQLQETSREQLDSNLLAMLFAGLEEGQRLRVLDIGPGSAETVAFLSRYRCRLHCADLFEEADLLAPCEPDGEAERVEALRRALGVATVERFDICLFWDLFRYLDPSALRLLGRALAPAVTDKTLAHAFLCHGRVQPGQTAFAARRYGIVAPGRMSLQPCHRDHLPTWNHTQRAATDLLGCFGTDKSRLLQGGVLEVLLQGARS